MSSVLQQQSNTVTPPLKISNLRFVDATQQCLDGLQGFGGVENYAGVLADPSDLASAKAKLEELFIGDKPEDTLIVIDGWFNADLCPSGKVGFSEPAREMFSFVTSFGFHAVIFRGHDDGEKSCGLAVREVVQSYLT